MILGMAEFHVGQPDNSILAGRGCRIVLLVRRIGDLGGDRNAIRHRPPVQREGWFAVGHIGQLEVEPALRRLDLQFRRIALAIEPHDHAVRHHRGSRLTTAAEQPDRMGRHLPLGRRDRVVRLEAPRLERNDAGALSGDAAVPLSGLFVR